MMKPDRVLVILLRILGVGALFALVAVFMPVSWMTATHRWLGLGEMPNAPVVEYLARSLSAFYALMGALCLVVAADLERYRPLVRFLGVAFALMSLVLLGTSGRSSTAGNNRTTSDSRTAGCSPSPACGSTGTGATALATPAPS